METTLEMEAKQRKKNLARGTLLKNARLSFGKDHDEWAALVGISKAMVYKIESGEGFSLDNAKKLCSITGLDLTQILWGDTEGHSESAELGNKLHSPIKLDPDGSKYYQSDIIIFMPYLPIKFHASFVENCNNLEHLELETIRVFVDREYKNGIVIEINGDSMSPELIHESRVIAIPVAVENWFYMNPGIYAVSYGNKLVVKTVKENNLKREGFLRLYSDNAFYGYEDALANEIHCIYQCVEVVRKRLIR